MQLKIGSSLAIFMKHGTWLAVRSLVQSYQFPASQPRFGAKTSVLVAIMVKTRCVCGCALSDVPIKTRLANEQGS